jgi:MFS transporter, SP family, arabinose:H+ symporter
MTNTPVARAGGSPVYLVVICLVAALGGLLFGFDTAVISGSEVFFTREFSLSPEMEGWVVGSAIVGCFWGALAAGVLSDRFGRKKVLLLSALFFTASAVWCGLVSTAQGLVYARLLGGLGIGIASLVSPLYIAEISPPKIRGRLVALQQLAIVLGILGAFFGNSLVLKTAMTDAAKWRWMLALGAFPAALFFVLILPIPESPRWLTKQGLKAKARAILARVAGEAGADREMVQIADAIAREGSSLRELFRPGLRRALLVGTTLAVLTQVTGINAIMYYGPKVFDAAGFGTSAAYWCSVLVGVTNLVFTLLSMAVVDRLGRKPLLLIGSTCMGVALCAVGFSFHSSSLFTDRDIKDSATLVGRVQTPTDPVSTVVNAELSRGTDSVVSALRNAGSDGKKQLPVLLAGLNQMLKKDGFYASDRFAAVPLSAATLSLAGQKPTGEQRARLNRMLLEDAYPDALAHKPYHRGINGWEMLLGVLAYVASFAFSMGVVGWVVISEIYPTRTRGRAMSVATAGVWGACYLVSLTFPLLLARLGSAVTFWTYGAMCAVALVFVWFFVPETKGKSLEEIEKQWGPTAS